MNFIKISFIFTCFACLQGCGALRLSPYTQYEGLDKSTISFMPVEDTHYGSGAITFKEAKNCTGRLMLQDASRNSLVRNYIKPNLVFSFQRNIMRKGELCSFFGFFIPHANRDYFLESEFIGNHCNHMLYELIDNKKVMLPIKVSTEEEYIMTENSSFCNSDNITNYINGEFSIPLTQPQQLEIPIVLP